MKQMGFSNFVIKKSRLLPIFLVLQFNLIVCYGQIKELKIGDTCPDIEFKGMFNYPTKNAKLSDFKGKLVLLDFWFIYCSACIDAMPHMQELQKEFGDRIQIITVNKWNNRDFLIKWWKENKITKHLQLPCITDSTLYGHFKHSTNPHEVWIDGDGIVRAITEEDYVTSKNIKAILNNEKIDWMVKKDVEVDPEKALVTLTNTFGGTQKSNFYTALTGSIDGFYGSWAGIIRDTNANLVRRYAINISAKYLYKDILRRYPEIFLSTNRIVLEVKDSSRYIFNKNKDYYDAWTHNNRYCYEAVLPLQTTNEELDDIMRQDLNKYLGLNGRMETRLMDCFVIEKLGAVSYNKRTNIYQTSTTDTFITYDSLSQLTNDLNGINDYPIIVCESDCNVNMKYLISGSAFKNVNELRKDLNKYGYTVTPRKKELSVFVITEK